MLRRHRNRFVTCGAVVLAAVLASCSSGGSPAADDGGLTVAGATTGDCFDAYPAGDEELELVDCTAPHEFEVFATVAIDVPGDRYRPAEEMTPIALDLCPSLEDAIANSADLTATVLVASEGRWNDGEHGALCVLHHASLLKIDRRQTPTE